MNPLLRPMDRSSYSDEGGSTLRVASFFAGIGGFELGFERAGMQVVFQCEIDPHALKILSRHWPEVPKHEDIQTLAPAAIPASELWCAGWPCQDLSNAKPGRDGLNGEKSGLYYDFLRLASEVHPTWLVLENVPGLISAEQGAALEAVADSLEEAGYLGGWFSCNLRDAGLPQNRDRVFIVATHRSGRAYHFFAHGRELPWDSPKGRASGSAGETGSTVPRSPEGNTPVVVQRRGGFGYTKASRVCPAIRAQTGKHQGGHSDRPILCGQELDVDRVRETDGVPRRLDGRRGRLIGNAVSPVISEWIGRRILAVERECAGDLEA